MIVRYGSGYNTLGSIDSENGKIKLLISINTNTVDCDETTEYFVKIKMILIESEKGEEKCIFYEKRLLIESRFFCIFNYIKFGFNIITNSKHSAQVFVSCNDIVSIDEISEVETEEDDLLVKVDEEKYVSEQYEVCTEQHARAVIANKILQGTPLQEILKMATEWYGEEFINSIM